MGRSQGVRGCRLAAGVLFLELFALENSTDAALYCVALQLSIPTVSVSMSSSPRALSWLARLGSYDGNFRSPNGEHQKSNSASSVTNAPPYATWRSLVRSYPLRRGRWSRSLRLHHPQSQTFPSIPNSFSTIFYVLLEHRHTQVCPMCVLLE
mgnify:CR=1 FL=1